MGIKDNVLTAITPEHIAEHVAVQMRNRVEGRGHITIKLHLTENEWGYLKGMINIKRLQGTLYEITEEGKEGVAVQGRLL